MKINEKRTKFLPECHSTVHQRTGSLVLHNLMEVQISIYTEYYKACAASLCMFFCFFFVFACFCCFGLTVNSLHAEVPVLINGADQR